MQSLPCGFNSSLLILQGLPQIGAEHPGSIVNHSRPTGYPAATWRAVTAYLKRTYEPELLTLYFSPPLQQLHIDYYCFSKPTCLSCRTLPSETVLATADKWLESTPPLRPLTNGVLISQEQDHMPAHLQRAWASRATFQANSMEAIHIHFRGHGKLNDSWPRYVADTCQLRLAGHMLIWR